MGSEGKTKATLRKGCGERSSHETDVRMALSYTPSVPRGFIAGLLVLHENRDGSKWLSLLYLRRPNNMAFAPASDANRERPIRGIHARKP